MASLHKPILLISVTPVYGHLMPMRALAQLLLRRGYHISVLTGTAYRDVVEAAGLSFIPLIGLANYSEKDFSQYLSEMPLRKTQTEQLEYYWRKLFVETIPSQHKSIQNALRDLKAQNPNRNIVLIPETLAWGAIPLLLNAPGLRPTSIITVGTVALYLTSATVPPFSLGLLPDESESGRRNIMEMNRVMQQEHLGQLQSTFLKLLFDLGAEETSLFFLDAAIILPSRYLQMGIPGLEYPRTEAPASIRYVGALPQGSRDPSNILPEFWDELTTSDKRVIVISQGTLAIDYTQLLAPAMQGLKDLEDTVVVIVLGKKGATLPDDIQVPPNAHVVDFIPYDELFPLCSLVVTNGGYGSMLHAVSFGLPLVIAGTTEDKSENSARAEWAGIAVNLRTSFPTPDQVLSGVMEILSVSSYKQRALDLQLEMKDYSIVDLVIENIEEVALS